MSIKNHHKDDLLEIFEQIEKRPSANRRYASYDFCYGYFQTHRYHLTENMELSCLHLWAYLASWGMLRGSSQLLKECSMKILSVVVNYIDKLPEELWTLDVSKYKSIRARKRIIKVFNELKEKLQSIKFEENNKSISATTTLITKIMIGTLGCIPAFDQNFVLAFKSEFDECSFTTVDDTALKCIYSFYKDNVSVLQFHKHFVIGFNGKPQMGIRYKSAKLIDMYGYHKGIKIAKQNNEINKQKSKKQ